MIQQAPLNHLMSFLVEALHHSNWHIREEAIQIMIAAMLITSDTKFDFRILLQPLSRLMDDPKSKVRSAFLEAIAVLGSKVGR
mmetsp:Transcript_23545/g.11340  ORF Transcript_23545/g.11340 Transcript_23545/m.11340 type:complete len:83 (-) Transcript_23545:561-809(-)